MRNNNNSYNNVYCCKSFTDINVYKVNYTDIRHNISSKGLIRVNTIINYISI